MATTDSSRLAPTGDRTAAAFITAGVVSLLTLGTAFTLLALDIEFFWVAFPVGFGGVLPLAVGVAILASNDRE
jgi:hypothetical protein